MQSSRAKLFMPFDAMKGLSSALKREEELPEAGADWIFIYLTLGFLVDKDNYPTLKKKVLERAEWLLHHHELNVAKYYDRMDEIISYMENNVKL